MHASSLMDASVHGCLGIEACFQMRAEQGEDRTNDRGRELMSRLAEGPFVRQPVRPCVYTHPHKLACMRTYTHACLQTLGLADTKAYSMLSEQLDFEAKTISPEDLRTCNGPSE